MLKTQFLNASFLIIILALSYTPIQANALEDPKKRRPYEIPAKDPVKRMQQWKEKLGDSYWYRFDHKYKLIIVSAAPLRKTKRIHELLQRTADSHWKTLFTNKPDHYISVVICHDSLGFEKLVGKWGSKFGGLFRAGTRTLYCKTSSLGLVRHEFTHAIHAADAKARGQFHPHWVKEGLATLFEDSVVDKKTGELVARKNNRLGAIQRYIRDGTYVGWDALFTCRQGVKMNHRYSIARFIFFYLHEKGLLKEFYREYTSNHASDKRGVKSLQKVLGGGDMEDVEAEWLDWVMSLRSGKRQRIGIRCDSGYKGKGARLAYIEKDSPALRGGLKVGDILLQIDGKPVQNPSAIQRHLFRKKPGDKVTLKVIRDEAEMEFELELGEKKKPIRIKRTYR